MDVATAGGDVGAHPYPGFGICIVDDEERVLTGLSRMLRSAGITNLVCLADGSRLLDTLSGGQVGVVLLDLAMPGLSGAKLLPLIRLQYPDLPIIVVTGAGDVATAVACMKAGACDYLAKPVEGDTLLMAVRRAIDLQELRRENMSLRRSFFADTLDDPGSFAEIVTESPRVRAMLLYVEGIARTSQPVLITGETGSGKELVARAVHRASKRSGQLVAVNVSGLDEAMLSDALFGHTRGAFTGAEESRGGLVEKAAGGTLFLDEIGELPIGSQVKLLRLIETGEYMAVGSDEVRQSSARVVVATNRELDEALESGSFRRDLYYRLRTHHVRVPPLREHLEDLRPLVELFLEQAARELGKHKPTAPPELLTLLGVYDFPGNIRELRSMVFDAVSEHVAGTLSLRSFKKAIGGDGVAKAGTGGALVLFPERVPTIRQAVDLLVAEVMRRSQGNQTVAAHLLGISPQALGKRLKKARHERG